MRVQGLNVSFGDKHVLRDFSAEFSGGVTCLVGPSGCGKTTLLRVIAGLLRPDSGTVEQVPGKISFMFQDDRLFPWLTALQNVQIVCDDADRARKYLAAVELEGEEDSYPSSLSGGMRRRVALARALAYGGDMLILDEPFKGMDLPLVRRLAPLIRELDIPVLLSTHSPEEQEIMGGEVLDMQRNAE